MAPSGEKVKTNPGARVLMEEVGALGISVDDCQKEGNRVAKTRPIYSFTFSIHQLLMEP